MNLFDDSSAGVTEDERIRQTLIDTYAACLLAKPPIEAVRPSNPQCAANALRFAAKDVNRVLEACETAGLMIVRKS